MVIRIFSYPSPAAEARLNAVAQRGFTYSAKDTRSVVGILKDVRRRGDDALIGYVNQFDAPSLGIADLKVTAAEWRAAAKSVDQRFQKFVDLAASQIQAFHRLQVRRSWIDTPRGGVMLGQLVRPVERAGIYVPGGAGGKTPLVSTVLMTAIPARIAGVGQVVMATPPTREGHVDPHLLVAARKAGVDAVYKVGSAWAVAALAYGTATVPRVDVIAGPGNIYVTLAKKLVAGTVGIDMIAGPSEILIVADHTADPEFIAADLLSQAEHDPLASSMLITTDKALARAAVAALQRQAAAVNRRQIVLASLSRYGAVVTVPDLSVAMTLANRIAPEHLELHVAEPFAWIEKVRNAGAVFLGHHSPEAVGDYIAGPNHVLPTAGTARFSSALGVETFMKKISLIHYRPEALAAESEAILALARAEGLDAHAASVKVRLKG
jgi:histidinol dehydrogenase